jgi:hypothetical protein
MRWFSGQGRASIEDETYHVEFKDEGAQTFT